MLSKALSASLVFCSMLCNAQRVAHIYKAKDLFERIEKEKKILVVNFWATWCKPCVEEIAAFDSLHKTDKNVKVLLVNIDFKEKEAAVNSFLQKKKITAECVLLDEINGNDYIDKVSKNWSGAIPATLIRNGKRSVLLEKKLNLYHLHKEISKLR